MQPKTLATIPYDAMGYIVTSDAGRERYSWRDTVRNLNDTYESIFPEEAAAAAAARSEKVADDSKDASDKLAAELAELKESGGDEAADFARAERFKHVNLDLKACVFVRMKWRLPGRSIPPSWCRMLTNTRDKGEPVSRHTLRIVPVEKVCFAAVEDVVKAAKPLIDEAFPADCEEGKEKTFAVVFNSRANSTLRRSELVPEIANLVPEPHKVELSKPQLVVLVEAVKGVATVAVVKDYYGLLKYNQRLLSMNEEERQAERALCMPPAKDAEDKEEKKEADGETEEETRRKQLRKRRRKRRRNSQRPSLRLLNDELPRPIPGILSRPSTTSPANACSKPSRSRRREGAPVCG